MWAFFLIIAVIIGFFVYKNSLKTMPNSKSSLSQSGCNFDFEIVGEGSYQSALRKIAGPKRKISHELYVDAEIVHEPKNTYDPNAFKVTIKGHLVGYFSRDDAQRFRKILINKKIPLDTVFKVKAVIVGGWKDEVSEGHYGVKLNIPFTFDFV